jgi:membrane protease YdiL (CAAX protease family)
MKFLRETTPFTQIIFTLIIILMGGVTISLIGFLGCWLWLGIGFQELSGLLANFGDPGNLGLLKFFQILQTVGMFVLPPLLIAYSMDDKPFQFLKLSVKPDLKMLLFVCAVILFSGPMIEWLSLVNQQLSLPSWMSSLEKWMRTSEDQATEITKAFLSTKSIGGLLGNLVIVAVLPAIGEELLFRGLLQKLIQKMTGNSHAAIWITAILFSALHLQFFGFLPRLLLGALFGYLLYWTGNLWLPIIAHFVNNAAGVIIYFVTREGLEPDQPDTPIFTSSQFFYAVVSVVIVWFLLRYIYLKQAEKAAKHLASNNLS